MPDAEPPRTDLAADGLVGTHVREHTGRSADQPNLNAPTAASLDVQREDAAMRAAEFKRMPVELRGHHKHRILYQCLLETNMLIDLVNHAVASCLWKDECARLLSPL